VLANKQVSLCLKPVSNSSRSNKELCSIKTNLKQATCSEF
jgi:hypothetical protein